MDDEYDDDEEDNDRDFYEEEDEVVLQSYQKWLILVLTKHLCYVLCSL